MQSKMINNVKNLMKECGIYICLLVFQFVCSVIFNFKYTIQAMDPDSAKLFRHTIEMSRNHSLWIPD